MTSYNWTTGTGGDWGTAANWTPAAVPGATDDVTIDATPTAGAYIVTIGTSETETINSLTMNGTNNIIGANSNPYDAAELVLDGTLAFAAGSAGLIDGSLQTYIFTDSGSNAEIINPGTINGFIQVQGNMLLTGTNGIYITNDIQAQGTVTIDTKSIAEMSGNTLFDGIYQAIGPGAATINLGGTLEGLIVNVTTLEGPQANPGGWTELTFNGPDTVIDEWNGTTYVPIESTLTEISGGGTVDVMTGRAYTTTNTLTIDNLGSSVGAGMLNLQAGTVTTAGLAVNGGIVQGNGTIAGAVANNGTVMAVGGTLDLTGSLTGTGTVAFDYDIQQQTTNAVGATLVVNSVSAGQTIVMNGDDTLVLDAPAAFAGVIKAGVGDKIVLAGVTATSAVLNNGTLVVFDGAQTVASLAVSANYASDHVAVSGSTLTFAAGAGAVVPTITGTVARQTTTSEAPVTPFAGVTISDPNSGATDTLSIILSGSGGTLAGSGLTGNNGVYSLTGTALAITTELDALSFTPTAGAPNTISTTSFALSDTSSAFATPVTDSTTTVIDTDPAVAPPISGTVAPTITGTLAGQALMDNGTITPFSNVMIGDANSGQTETLTVTLSAAANGTLTNLGGGSYDATAGIYTDTGSATAVTSALDGLVFVPTAQQVTPGQTVSTSFTISDVDSASASATDATTSVTATAAALPIKNFTITDTTTGITTTSAGTTYSGPVANLQNEFVTTTADSLAITATAPNSFIHSGSGNDAIDVSKVNGTNVLDGSTGSNFLVGGTGFDTFFLDDRGPTSDVFSTVVNFHSGDNATVWGVTASDFTMHTYDNQGAAGYKGLDFSFTASGKPDANLVLTGFSSADIADKRLTVTFGTTPTTDGIAGSSYMLIHAN